MSDTAAQLKAHGLTPRKDLGQHYLIDPEAVVAVADAAKLSKTDTVVEVGAGPGILTPLLAERVGKVIAIEFDAQVLPTLRANTATLPNVEIQQSDILATDPVEFPNDYKVVGNLPYYITSAILKHFLGTLTSPQSLTVMLQQEVAERIVAQPPKMSILALSVQLYGEPTIVRKVSKDAFWPPPKVDSAILTVTDIRKKTPMILDGVSEEQFFTVVRAGFAEKRKQLHNTLARHLALSHEQALKLLQKAKIDPARRAETLTIAEWVALVKLLRP